MNVDRLAYQVGGAIKRLRADLAKAEQDAAMWHEAHDNDQAEIADLQDNLAKAQEALRGLVEAVERSTVNGRPQELSPNERGALARARAALPDEGKR